MPQRTSHLAHLLSAALSIAASLTTAPFAALAQRRPPAQPPAPPPQDPTALEAQRAYDAGLAASSAGNHEQAIAHFRRAYELRSFPIVLIALASAQESLGHVPDAIETLERFLREAPADAHERPTAQERVATLRQRPAILHAVSTPTGAHILLDGTDTGQISPADVSVSTGHHAVRFELAGHVATGSEVDTRPGERIEVTGTLEAEPPPPPPPVVPQPEPPPSSPPEPEGPRGPSTAVWAAGAISLAGVVSGTVFGLLALGDLGTYNTEGMATRALKDRGESFALVADISFVTAILAGGIAVIVFAADRTPEPAAAQPAADAPAADGAPRTSRLRFVHPREQSPRVRVSPFGLSVQF